MHRSKKVNRKAKKSPKRKRSGLTALSRIHPQVAGIDLGSREHWVCAPEVSKGTPNVRTFGTTMPQLQQLAEWLLEQGVESVAMESTNVYWIPLYELLESCGIEVLLVNARQLRHVPGPRPTCGTANGFSCCIAAACCGDRSVRTRSSSESGPCTGN